MYILHSRNRHQARLEEVELLPVVVGQGHDEVAPDDLHLRLEVARVQLLHALVDHLKKIHVNENTTKVKEIKK